jgi:hypothetical protein
MTTLTLPVNTDAALPSVGDDVQTVMGAAMASVISGIIRQRDELRRAMTGCVFWSRVVAVEFPEAAEDPWESPIRALSLSSVDAELVAQYSAAATDLVVTRLPTE